MAKFQRSTRECTVDGLRPALAAALRAYFAQRGLDEDLAASLICCETTSTRRKRGLFRSGEEVLRTGVVLTPRWLIWATARGSETPGVLSARLRDIRVEDYEQSAMYELQPDSGVTIFGLHTGDGIGSAFIGLGPEPAARRFRERLQHALAEK